MAKNKDTDIIYWIRYRLHQKSKLNESGWHNVALDSISLSTLSFIIDTKMPLKSILEATMKLSIATGAIQCYLKIKEQKPAKNKGQFLTTCELLPLTDVDESKPGSIIAPKDQRRSVRRLMGYPFSYEIKKTGKKAKGFIRDISLFGLYFITSLELDFNTEIIAEVTLIDKTFKIQGKVVRTTFEETNGLYNIGLDLGNKFDDFKKLLWEKLTKFYSEEPKSEEK